MDMTILLIKILTWLVKDLCMSDYSAIRVKRDRAK